jgi:hypothetical protein
MSYIGKDVLIQTKKSSTVYRVISETKSKKTLTLQENEIIEKEEIPVKIHNVFFSIKNSHRIEYKENSKGNTIKIRLNKKNAIWFILNNYEPIDMKFL